MAIKVSFCSPFAQISFSKRQSILMVLHDKSFDIGKLSLSARTFDGYREKLNKLSVKQRKTTQVGPLFFLRLILHTTFADFFPPCLPAFLLSFSFAR